MGNIKEFTKNHFVEVIGFISILLIIILISYLKVFKKTFVCEMRTTEGKSKIFQKYTITQSNNKLKQISYYYRATTPDKDTKKQVTEFYKNIINEHEDKIFNNDIRLSYKDNKLILSYDIDLNEVKHNKVYKNASTFVKSVKASGFSCT